MANHWQHTIGSDPLVISLTGHIKTGKDHPTVKIDRPVSQERWQVPYPGVTGRTATGT
jgi:hypothetical protein